MATEKNFVETVLEAQQKFVDNVIENTKNMSNNNAFVNESMEKGQDFYKNWLENQKKAFAGTTEKVETATNSAKENFEKAGTFYQEWLNKQVEMAKKGWETSQNFIQNNMKNTPNMNTTNPMEMFNNWNKWYTQFQNANNWSNIMNQMNPTNFMDQFKTQNENYTKFFNEYQDLLKKSFGQLTENMNNQDQKDVFANMMSATSGFAKFYEMWMPFMKSIQDKTFNMEQFKTSFNMDAYKDFMNNFFGFNTDETSKYMQQFTDMFQNYAKDAATQGKNAYQQANEAFKSMNPFAGMNMFEQAANTYNKMQETFANAVSPIAKMATPNQYTKSYEEWTNLIDKTAIFNIKNAEMQYMVYQQGQKVMDALVENITSKMEQGVEINNVTALYQEWLNIGDKVYVELFESDEYSQIMAEVSAMQLKLRKDYELQMEKMMNGIPVATKSDLDELYKTIYDLKKEVRQLEKMMELTEVESTENNTEKTATAKKTTTTTTTKK
ncbi:MAG TPA: poly(R)-hydroxyalkanoic acid synthase subunit PhaE [Edaphocola sp.]|nr:poly(R)-hydroxyalkanoic acid synthase subunit PhaE [Edaphocola sp.]